MPELDVLSRLHFLRPEWFLAMLPFAWLNYLQWRRNTPGRQWQGVIAAHLLPRMILPGNSRRWISPLGISTILGPLLVLALAGPSWSRGESPFAQDSAALVIAVDLGESMGSRDLQPDRLQRARSKILAVARARGDAYTALLAYAGSGHAVLPLSNDSDVLLHHLEALRVGMLPRRGKAPESILPQARRLLEERGGGTLLIVGDGAGDSAAAEFEALRDDKRIQLLVWGMGRTQAQLQADEERGLVSDALPLQEKQLEAIARAGGGSYRSVTVDERDVRDVLRRIDRHYELSEDNARPWIDGGYYLVPVIMALFLLWFRAGWTLQW
jgi:Ca-activated chloride channel family protein